MSISLNLCSIYKSPKEEEMYLYVPKTTGLKDVPAPLIEMFGKPKHVMDMLLKDGRTLARVDVKKVITELKTKGFYLQMPPPKEDLLKEHLTRQKGKQS